jgi:hypothetical protein
MKRKRKHVLQRFIESCDKELIPPEPRETKKQRDYRLAYSVREKISMFIDCRLYERGQRGALMRLYWQAEDRVGETLSAMRKEKMNRALRGDL